MQKSRVRGWISNMKNQGGQGLIEVLIVVLIISTSVLALLSFQNALAFADTLSQQQNEATILAQSKIASLRDYQVVNVQSPYAAYQSIVSGTSTSTGSNATYTINWTVIPFTSPTYKSVDVVVGWNDLRGGARAIRLISYVAGLEPGYSASVMY